MATRLTHGFVFVIHLEPMIRFYEGVFGFVTERSSDAGFVRLQPADPAGAGVALHTLPPHIAAQIQLASPPRMRDDTAYKLCFATDDLDAAAAAILAHGGQVGKRWDWEGTRFAECADPEGNVVQIYQR